MKRRTVLQNPWWLLLSTAALLAIATAQRTVEAAGPGMHGRVFALDEAGKITGVVAGAKIELKNAAGAAAGQTTSTPNGYYSIDLPPGRYFYKVTAGGYKDEDEGRGVALQLSEGYAVYNFSLTKGETDPDRKPPDLPVLPIGLLQGRVLEQKPDGQYIGVPGANIALRRQAAGLELARVVARRPDKSGKGTGHYKVILEAGSWRASVSAKGFDTLVDPAPIPIESGKVTTRDFVLKRIVPDLPENQGIKATVALRKPYPGGSAPPEVNVYVTEFPGAAQPGPPMTLDDRGQYSRDLAAGRYRVTATAKGYRTARAGPTDVFPDKYTFVRLYLVPKPLPEPPPDKLVFQGQVYEQLPGTQTRRPLPGASVLIRRPDQSLADAPRGATDKQGKVTLQVAAVGEHVVLAQKPGYRPGGAKITITAAGPNSRAITLAKEPEDIEPTPPPTPPDEQLVTVTGYVVYRDPASRTGLFGIKSAELAWARLGAAAAGVQRTRTGEVGRYGLELAAGTYQVNVSPPAGSETRFTGVSEKVEVRQGMKPKYFFLKRLSEPEPPPADTVEVRGYVVTRSATSSTGYTGVAGARIIWTRGLAFGMPATSSDRLGRFSISLEKGAYQTMVKAPPGFMAFRKQVQVQPGMRDPYFILVRESSPGPEPPPDETLATLNIRVLEAATGRVPRPVPGAEVALLQNNRRVTSGRADLLGRVSLRVKPGSYELLVRQKGFRESRGMMMLRGGQLSRDVYLKRLGPPPETFVTLVVQVAAAGPAKGRMLKFVAGANVSVMQGRRLSASGQTDRAGRYSARLKPGGYKISVTHPMYFPGQDSANLTAGNVSRRIVLRPRKIVPQTPGTPLKPLRPLEPTGPVPIQPLPIRPVPMQPLPIRPTPATPEPPTVQ